ncbi:MAG TPA: hypothetical protein VFB38_08465 [Chthonomonadaceae bacterium]|nr:hypothetical protein [Chthonomonadaceae bacterium]
MLRTQPMSHYFSASGCPATILLIALNIVTFFLGVIPQTQDRLLNLVFFSSAWQERFWTLVTWPLIGPRHPLFLLFACIWAYWVCGSLERSWGTRTFVGFFLAVSALTALTTWAGAQLLGTQAALASVWVALAAPTVAWCTINSRESVSLYGLLTIPAPLMALLTVVLVWFEVGPPLLGLFALSGCAAAYAYVRYGRSPYRGYATVRRPWEKAPVLRLRTFAPEREAAERGGFAPLRWWRAWQERRQLARLYRRSRSVDQEGKDNR